MSTPRSDPLPVRLRLTLLDDGSTARSPVVYCDPQRRTVPLDRCSTCAFAGPVQRDPSGTPRFVGCSRFAVPSSPPVLPLAPSIAGRGVQGIAASFSVGLVLTRDILCVAMNASLGAVARAVTDDLSAAAIPIVDAQARLLAVLPRALTRLLLVASFADDPVTEHSRETELLIREDRPLADAFATMAAHHARELTVLDADRRVVGALRDLDALRFVAHLARTGLRPSVA